MGIRATTATQGVVGVHVPKRARKNNKSNEDSTDELKKNGSDEDDSIMMVLFRLNRPNQ
jgi:hypothetical protein